MSVIKTYARCMFSYFKFDVNKKATWWSFDWCSEYGSASGLVKWLQLHLLMIHSSAIQALQRNFTNFGDVKQVLPRGYCCFLMVVGHGLSEYKTQNARRVWNVVLEKIVARFLDRKANKQFHPICKRLSSPVYERIWRFFRHIVKRDGDCLQKTVVQGRVGDKSAWNEVGRSIKIKGHKRTSPVRMWWIAMDGADTSNIECSNVSWEGVMRVNDSKTKKERYTDNAEWWVNG